MQSVLLEKCPKSARVKWNLLINGSKYTKLVYVLCGNWATNYNTGHSAYVKCIIWVIN